MGSQKVLYVGIGGKKRHGKDTFADALSVTLRNDNNWVWPVKRAFAAALRQEVSVAFGARFVGHPGWPDNMLDCTGRLNDLLCSNVTAEKEPFRLLMQWWGTEFRRGMFGDDYWLQRHHEWVTAYLNNCSETDKIVVLIPDVRFPNEMEYVQSRGGLLLKVIRSGMDGADDHASETLLDAHVGWDAIIPNDGSREDLNGQAQIIQKLLISKLH